METVNGRDEWRGPLLRSLKGWLTAEQIKNIEDAMDDGRFSPIAYFALKNEYIEQGFDNGGFTPREQYALQFANRY